MVLSSLVHYLAEVESVLSPPLGLDQVMTLSIALLILHIIHCNCTVIMHSCYSGVQLSLNDIDSLGTRYSVLFLLYRKHQQAVMLLL